MQNHRPAVLVVEDESVVAMDLERNLETLGYDVVGIADRGLEAIRLAEEKRPELVLMDIKLGDGMDGIDAAREIRDRWRIPVVFLTANTNPETFERAQRASPLGYLTKPYRVNDLSAALVVALSQHAFTSELFAEKTWFGTLLESLSDAVVATDTEGFVRYMSPLAQSLTGWTGDSALGRPIEDVVRLERAEGAPLVRNPIREVLQGRPSPSRTEFVLRGRNGEQRYIEGTAAPVTTSGGKLMGAVSVFLDSSDRHEAEKEQERLRVELERSNEELARFSHAISHDLISPLRTIRTSAELLLEEGRMTERQSHFLEKIVSSAIGMNALIEATLEFAKVGQGELRREPVDIDEVMTQVVTLLSAQLHETGAKVTWGPLPVVQANRVQMEQVFQNLIGNAVKYRKTGTGPLIEVSGGSDGDGWWVAVEDNGIGIAQEYQERIFEPLKRLHGPEIPGTGLGLALCRKIVERHGGRIWVESPGEGLGSTFFIYIPRGGEPNLA